MKTVITALTIILASSTSMAELTLDCMHDLQAIANLNKSIDHAVANEDYSTQTASLLKQMTTNTSESIALSLCCFFSTGTKVAYLVCKS